MQNKYQSHMSPCSTSVPSGRWTGHREANENEGVDDQTDVSGAGKDAGVNAEDDGDGRMKYFEVKTISIKTVS